MAYNKGTAIIDFGSGAGTNEAYVTVNDSTISLTSVIGVDVMGDTTSNHSVSDHRYFSLIAKVTPGNIIAGTSFDLFAVSTQKLTGQFQVRWVWSD
jgi:hypothetical protein